MIATKYCRERSRSARACMALKPLRNVAPERDPPTVAMVLLLAWVKLGRGSHRIYQGCSRVMARPSDQEVFKIPRVGPDRVGLGGVRNLAGRVGSGQEVFKTSRAGSVRVRLGDPTRPDPTREFWPGP